MEITKENQNKTSAPQGAGSSFNYVPLRSFGSIIEYDSRLELKQLSKEIPRNAFIFNGGNTYIVVVLQ